MYNTDLEDQNDDCVTSFVSLLHVDNTWRKSAACLGLSPSLFFSSDLSDQRKAKEVCKTCPVIETCYKENRHEKEGIWGGKERYRKGLALDPLVTSINEGNALWQNLITDEERARAEQTEELICRRPTKKHPMGRQGTHAGYYSHTAANQTPCPECSEARRKYRRAAYNKKEKKTSKK